MLQQLAILELESVAFYLNAYECFRTSVIIIFSVVAHIEIKPLIISLNK